MKINSLVILFVCLPVIFVLAQNSAPSIEFIETTYDFGDIREADGPVEHTFEFTNKGTDVLIIQDIKASCGCTTPTWTREPVKPGEKGIITAVFNPEKRPGFFNKSLSIVSNAKSQQVLLYIKGNVEPIPRTPEEEYPVEIGGLRVKYKIISFKTVTNEKPVTKTFNVYNEMGKTMTFLDEYKAPDHITIKFNPQSIPPKTLGFVEITYDPRGIKTLGYNMDNIELKTDEWFNSVKKFRVIASLEEYFPPMTPEQISQAPKLKIENPVHDFGIIKQGESVSTDFVITNIGKETLNIRQTRATCGCTASKPEKSDLKSGESSIIKVTFNSTGRSGDQSKAVMVFSNDPSNPTQKIEIKATISVYEDDS